MVKWRDAISLFVKFTYRLQHLPGRYTVDMLYINQWTNYVCKGARHYMEFPCWISGVLIKNKIKLTFKNAAILLSLHMYEKNALITFPCC